MEAGRETREVFRDYSNVLKKNTDWRRGTPPGHAFERRASSSVNNRKQRHKPAQTGKEGKTAARKDTDEPLGTKSPQTAKREALLSCSRSACTENAVIAQQKQGTECRQQRPSHRLRVHQKKEKKSDTDTVSAREVGPAP